MKYRHILLIDDDTDDQEIFTMAVRQISESLECASLSNAKVALQKLNDNEIRPDVIFLDLNMPIMDGREFLRRIKAVNHLATIPVIIFSTSSDAGTIATTRELGAIDFITKPNKISHLVDALHTLLH